MKEVRPMQYRVFVIHAMHPQHGEEELNRFLASARVASITWRFVDCGEMSYWTCRVAVVPGDGPLPTSIAAGGRAAQSSSMRIDYREVLGEEEFALYSALRDVRRAIATEDKVEIFVVFTNEQLAEMVRRRVTTKAALAEIPRLGSARIAKYGDRIVTKCRELWGEAGQTPSTPTGDGATGAANSDSVAE